MSVPVLQPHAHVALTSAGLAVAATGLEEGPCAFGTTESRGAAASAACLHTSIAWSRALRPGRPRHPDTCHCREMGWDSTSPWDPASPWAPPLHGHPLCLEAPLKTSQQGLSDVLCPPPPVAPTWAGSCVTGLLLHPQPWAGPHPLAVPEAVPVATPVHVVEAALGTGGPRGPGAPTTARLSWDRWMHGAGAATVGTRQRVWKGKQTSRPQGDGMHVLVAQGVWHSRTSRVSPSHGAPPLAAVGLDGDLWGPQCIVPHVHPASCSQVPSPDPHLNLSCMPTPQLWSQKLHGDQADQAQAMGQAMSSHVTTPSWHTLGTEAGFSHRDKEKCMGVALAAGGRGVTAHHRLQPSRRKTWPGSQRCWPW